MADWACDELGGETPLTAARKPNMDLIATRGQLGLVATIPPGMPAGSDVGTMTMLGYDPARYHTGRAPIEAASQGIELGPDDIVFRMNLVSLDEGEDGGLRMHDFTAGHRQRCRLAYCRRNFARAFQRRYRIPSRRELSPSDGLAQWCRWYAPDAATRHIRPAG